MQLFFSQLLRGTWRQKVSSQVNLAETEHPTRHQAAFTQLAYPSWDATLIRLYKAIDIAG
jgi:hypothetical protein